MAAACEAYEDVLSRTITSGGKEMDEGMVVRIGRNRGYRGRVSRWNAKEAWQAMQHLREIVGEQGPVRVDCKCYPRKCHAAIVAKLVKKGW